MPNQQMRIVKSILTIAIAFISLSSSGDNCRMLLTSDIDLKGKTMTIPENTILVGRGGVIKNGIVVGTNTTVETNKAVFSDVSIQGTWVLPEISTSSLDCVWYSSSSFPIASMSGNTHWVKNNIEV